jgi:hypothetical protein
MTHTKEPWKLFNVPKTNPQFHMKIGSLIIKHGSEDDVIRAHACVNALKGIDIAAIEAGVVGDLVDAVQGLGAMPEGFCFCHENRIGDDSKVHYPECRDLRAALAKIGGAL